MKEIWNERTEYFDEIVDCFACAGIKYEADSENYTISVESGRYSEAYGILCELNNELNCGW